MSEQALQIPPEQLSGEALVGLLEAFVVREGTDYGELEWSFAEKVEQVRQQLQRGEIVIVFDLATESCTLMTKAGWKQLQREQAQHEESGRERQDGF
ncbi:MAG: YheU family protein [Spongiibacteraceae bacterium]